MNYEEFNQFCGSLPATTHIVQWGNSHVWKVGGKVFAIGGWSKDKQPAFTFKTSERNFYFLRECEGYIPAPYFANRGMKWIQQIDSHHEKDDDLQYYLTESHRLVSLGLTKSKQKELGLNQEIS
ncbi:MmcQ/YjbR family DNA-binding protein [Enterovibrio sp. ZSDZ42]|uniref:MmcQ/YjbR family DNA-binding protein n=1 Tax=Enterovibrio gelatinilyticus TaxID=2899819 RepID=A0ABT5R3X5_9GAMM|nr:MmcQ/YjbR family DNA-binding protein [Enterovibrio sp. ZSDZ42]MDD1794471.1 MmcQ/YjbR family DNA-binding protein [Enterovibrio sp. ZSDZ42]